MSAHHSAATKGGIGTTFAPILCKIELKSFAISLFYLTPHIRFFVYISYNFIHRVFDRRSVRLPQKKNKAAHVLRRRRFSIDIILSLTISLLFYLLFFFSFISVDPIRFGVLYKLIKITGPSLACHASHSRPEQYSEE